MDEGIQSSRQILMLKRSRSYLPVSHHFLPTTAWPDMNEPVYLQPQPLSPVGQPRVRKESIIILQRDLFFRGLTSRRLLEQMDSEHGRGVGSQNTRFRLRLAQFSSVDGRGSDLFQQPLLISLPARLRPQL